MTIQRMIELLEIEHECMLRKSHDGCDGKCGECELVQDDGELHEMYTDVIALLKGKEPTVHEIAEKYGLTPDGVEFALDQYQKIIPEITHSRMSKLSYYADDIIRVANDVQCDYCEYKEAQEPVEPVFERPFLSCIEIYDCGKCGTPLGASGIAKYCMNCGQAVKWE